MKKSMKKNNLLFAGLYFVLILFSIALTAVAARADLNKMLAGERADTGVSPGGDLSPESPGDGREAPFDAIECSVNGRNSVIDVKCFGNERDQHFIFLPSVADTEHSYISIPDNMSLAFRDEEGNTFTLNNGDSMKLIQVDRAYGASLIHDGVSEPEVFFMVTRARGLPSVFIYTDSGDFESINSDKEHREPGTILVFDGDGGLDYSGALEYIKGHGNHTWLRDKKSYNITLKRKAPLLGMHGSDKWVLLSNCMDHSNIRNSLAFYMSRNMGFAYTPSQEYAEVYLNGHYNGLYQLTEKVSVGDGRLMLNDLRFDNTMVNKQELYNYRNVTGKLSERGCACDGYEFSGNPPDITGGYIVERDYGEKFDSEKCKFTTSGGDRYVLKAPKYASLEEVEYIADRFDELEHKAGTGGDISDIADIKSFAGKYLLEEFVKNDGAQRTSAFFYKDSDSIDKHIFAGPVWDYDKAMNSDESTFPRCNRFLSYFTWYGDHTMLFFDLLFNTDYFWTKVKEEYQNSFEPMLRQLMAEGQVDALIERVRADDDMDSTRWDYSPTTGAYENENINTFIAERKEFFDDLFLRDGYKKLCTVTIKDERSSSDTILGIIRGERLDFDPEPHDSNDFERWYNTETGEKVDENTVIDSDIVIAAEYEED